LKISYGFVVPGDPQGKGRPRAARMGKAKFVRVYTPKETVDYENRIRLFFTERNMAATPIEGPVSMTIYAYFAIPRSVSKKKRAAMIAHEIAPTKRPDIDNIIKSFADALNGLAYKDDAQICHVACSKAYGETPQCMCLVSEYLPSILDHRLKCECGWEGSVSNAVADAHPDGRLSCPKCLRKVT